MNGSSNLRLAFALAIVSSLTLVEAHAQAPPSAAATTFEKSCYSCHSIGGGDKMGPDLKALSARRSREWVLRFVASPSAVKNSGDAAAVDLFKRYSPNVMPDQPLAPEQINAVIDLIDEVSASGTQFIPAGAKLARAVRPGDADRGMRLFTGETKLANGGPACISCHSIAGVGALGGGTLGPDLTTLNVRLTDPALIAAMQNPNFPTMVPVFANRALTGEEIVQLFALFQREAANASHDPARGAQSGLGEQSRFIIVGGVGMLIGLGTINLLWRRRLHGVREHLVRRKQS
jgi:mono/diheme cytochrome c family protein